MKAKVETITLALVLALTVFPVVLAQDTVEAGVVGVKPGDWVKYGVTRVGVSNIAWVYDAVWIKVQVSNVSGTVVTSQETIHYDDGDEDVSTGSWDVQCDTCRASYFIATDLVPGDKVGEYPVLDYQENKWVNVDLKLNGTEFRTYGGVTREVNLVKFSFVTPFYLYDEHATWERYWDKHTGFLLEEKVTAYLLGTRHNETNPESTYKVEIADTNMWIMETGRSLPWQTMIAVAIPVCAIIAVAVTTKLRNKNKNGAEEK